MDFNGERPKEKRDMKSGSCGFSKRQNTGLQRPSEEDPSIFIRHLSVRFCNVLDRIGASTEFRQLRQDCAISQEIIGTQSYQLDKPGSNFIFGSSSEGTTTPGLNSDIDMLLCDDNIPVVYKISDAVDGRSLLMIHDKHTQPGYVKLQLVHNGHPQIVYKRGIDRNVLESDVERRICLKHITMLDDIADKRNGPAYTNSYLSHDYVASFRCFKIPEFSIEWIGRKRLFRWPSKRMLDKMVTMGCFVVGVGHPSSKEKYIEWRLSFSLQERELMFSMNLVQHKCYIVLKLLKNDVLEPRIGKSISSYHLKTCMFFVIENTEAKLWNRNNLVQCVILCLNVLLKWVLEGYCPNYFINEENMFDRDLLRTHKKYIVQNLIHLLSNGCGFIFQIKLDCIGDFLKRVKKAVQIEYIVCKEYFVIKMHMVIAAITFRGLLCCRLNGSLTHLEALGYLHTFHMNLSQTKCEKDRTEQQTHKAFSYIIPNVHLQLAQSYASLAFSLDDFEAKYRLLHSCKYNLHQGRHCDMTSSSL